MKILHNVAALPDSDLPTPISHAHVKKPPAAIIELLRVLLKHVADEQNIAPRLIASADDLLARDDNAPIRALTGWRRGFWRHRAKIKRGEIALAENGQFG